MLPFFLPPFDEPFDAAEPFDFTEPFESLALCLVLSLLLSLLLSRLLSLALIRAGLSDSLPPFGRLFSRKTLNAGLKNPRTEGKRRWDAWR